MDMGKQVTVRPVSSSIASRTPATSAPERCTRVEDAVNKDCVVEKRYVQLGELFSGLRAITSGITAADRIIVGDLWRVSPGQKVTPQLTSIDALGNRP